MDSPTNEEEIAIFIAVNAIFVTIFAFYNMMRVAVTYMIENGYLKDKVSYNMIDKIPKQIEELDRMLRECETSCINNLRMNRHTFNVLCDLVRAKGVSSSKYVSLEEKVAIFLSILVHHKKNRIIAYNFRRSGQTISNYFNEVLNAVVMLGPELFVKPEPEPPNSTDSKWNIFEGCLGALDGTYIRVNCAEGDKARYRSRKGEIAMNVLGVCDKNMNFIFVLPGWEGSAADGRVLRDAVTRPNGLRIPHGQYYLTDAGYTNGPGFLAPYRSQRYHLASFRKGEQPQNHEEYFNKKHAQARNIIERCFGVLKMRWGILRSPSYYPMKTQGRIVMACCILHNLIRREMDVDPVEMELDQNQDVNNEFNGVGANDENGDEVDLIDSVETSDEWTAWRDTLAHQMYNAWRGEN